VEHWLFTQLARDGAASTLPRFCRGCGTGAGIAGRVGTLLGPEETGVFSLQAVAAVFGGGRGCCLFLENCTVDASI